MLSSAWLQWMVSWALLAPSLAQSCDRTIQGPIVIPVKNVTVEGGRLRRGMHFQYGSPAQDIAVAVSQGWNETYIYDQSAQCSEIPTAACTVGRGGAFDESASSTWESLSSISNLNSQDDVSANTGDNGLAGRDTLAINSTLSFKEVPVAIPRKSGPDYSSFGLGKGSRVLDVARNAGTIASKSWSLFWGQTGLTFDHAHDGAVVLGGIDETQTIGTNFTGDIRLTGTCRSGMIVEVTDIRIDLPDGGGGSLINSGVQGQGVNYCLETEFPMITMLGDHWEQWQLYEPQVTSLGNADMRARGGPNIWGLVYPPSNASKADLKIIISNSLEITIPNHQLVQAYYEFGSDGGVVVNETVRELMINPLQGVNANDIPKFGMTFFQAAYLHVNYESDQFTLWQAANPSGPGKFAGVGKSTIGCATEANSTSNTSNDTTSAPSSSSSSSSSSNNDNNPSLSGGAVGGIVAAAIVGTLALAGVAFFLYRRRKMQKRTGPLLSETATPLYNIGHEKPELMGSYADDTHRGSYGFAQRYTGGTKPELESVTSDSTRPGQVSYPPQEADTTGVHRPLMQPQELPSERY